MPSALESNQRSCRNGVGFQGISNSVDERVSITADVVSAVVVTYGDRAHLCVQVIERLADIGVLEILLVDNGSSAAAISVYQSGSDLTIEILSLEQNLGSTVVLPPVLSIFYLRAMAPIFAYWTTIISVRTSTACRALSMS